MKLISLKGRPMSLSGRSKTYARPLREVEAYWEALRETGEIPFKSQISPPGLENALPHIMMLERIAPNVTRFRYAGQSIHDLLGMNAARVPLSVLFSSVCQRDLVSAVEDVFTKPSILWADLVSKSGIGRPTLSGQMVLMPLRDANGDISHAFGAMTTEGRLGRVPRQFTEIRLKATRLILNRQEYVQPSSKAMEAQEPHQLAFQSKENGRPDCAGRPKLRVIEGDKP